SHSLSKLLSSQTKDRAAPGCRKRKTVEHPLRYRKSRFSIRVVPTASVRSFLPLRWSSRCWCPMEAGPQPTIRAGQSLEKTVSSRQPSLRPPLQTPQLQCRLPYIFSSRTKRQNGETAGISESSRSPHGLLLRL